MDLNLSLKKYSYFACSKDEALDNYGIGGAAYKGSMCRTEKFGVVEPMVDPVSNSLMNYHWLIQMYQGY